MVAADDPLDEPLDVRFMQALQAGARAWRAAVERQFRARGLTQSGWSAMAALAAGGSPPSQTELAQQLGVDGATLVATIDRLAGAGLIERTPSSRDRRVKLLVLTAQGQALAAELAQEAGALRRELLSRLDGAQVAVAAEVLEQLQGLLAQAGEGA